MTQGLISLIALVTTSFSQLPIISPLVRNVVVAKQEQVLASRKMDLTNRYEESDFVNEVFKDNILLALHYLNGREISRDVNWEGIRAPPLKPLLF